MNKLIEVITRDPDGALRRLNDLLARAEVLRRARGLQPFAAEEMLLAA